jgi:hypothetical protein
MNKGYISSRDIIKGISDSIIAKSENNDCVVRAIATATDMDYDSAHKFTKEIFKRKNKKGTYGFVNTINLLSKNNKQINGKSVKIISEEYNTMLYYVTVKGRKVLRRTTTGSFIKRYPVGTYIVTVRRHAFTIKDGVVIGNLADGKQMKKHINGAWKIG